MLVWTGVGLSEIMQRPCLRSHWLAQAGGYHRRFYSIITRMPTGRSNAGDSGIVLITDVIADT